MSPVSHQFCGHCGQALNIAGNVSENHKAPSTPLHRPTQRKSPADYTPPHLAEQILITRGALEGERKQVTVLFCDLVGSTSVAEHIGPDSMHRLLDRFFDLALDEIHRYQGTINQFLGDGFMALFGAPLAYEDHASRAVLAALSIQKAMDERRAEFTAREGLCLRARMGVNTGNVVVGKIGNNLRMDYTAVGDTTNLAARMEQMAEPDTVCVSERTYKLIHAKFDWQPLGSHAVKGKRKPVDVYRPLGICRQQPALGGRTLSTSAFVAREKELAALREATDRLLAGEGGIACILGEAGLGKSRLTGELRQAVASQPLLWLEGQSNSYGEGVSYWPFRQMVQHWANLLEEDSELEGFAKLRGKVESLMPDQVEEILPYLAILTGLSVPAEYEQRVKYISGQAMGAQIYRAIHRWVASLANQQPLVLVVEDMHWMDQSSVLLMQHLFGLVETIPLLLLGNARMEVDTHIHRMRDLCLEQYAERYLELALEPLSDQAVSQLVGRLLGEGELAQSVHELAQHRADGNPLFVEEIINSLIASRAIEKDPMTGLWSVKEGVLEMMVPETVQGVIMARIDRLHDELKEVLKIASVIGRKFLYRVIDEVCGFETAINGYLDQLSEQDLIRREQLASEIEYIFKHALVQEATYESILLDRRCELHRRVAECLEAIFEGHLERHYGLLARHYALAEDWEKAQRYLFLQGDQAVRMAADSEALMHYREAVDAYARAFGDRWDPEERGRLESRIGEAMYARGDHQQSIAYFQQALARFGNPYPRTRRAVRTAILRQLAIQFIHRLMSRRLAGREAAGENSLPAVRTRIYAQMGWMHYFIDQEHYLLDLLWLLNTAEAHGVAPDAALGAMGTGVFFDLMSLHRIARGYHYRALRLARKIRHPRAQADTHVGLSWHYCFQARWGKAIGHAMSAAKGYKAIGNVREWGASSGMAVHMCRFNGQLEVARKLAVDHIDVGRESGDRHVLGWGLQGMGFVKTNTGPPEEAEAHLEQAIEIFLAIPAPGSAAEAASDLTHCLLRRGEVERAVVLMEKHNQQITELGIVTSETIYPLNTLVEAYLALAEKSEGREKAQALKQAARALRRSQRQARTHRCARPYAMRLRGTLQWLRGDEATALKSWKRAIETGEALGTPLFVAQANRETGYRTASRDHLVRAQTLFRQYGASLDEEETGALLEAL